MAYRPQTVGLIPMLFAIPLLIISTYRVGTEFRTYFWKCYPAKINSVKTVKTSRGPAVAVSYTIEKFPQSQFNRITPIANNEFRSDDELTFPLHYESRINDTIYLKACTPENGNTAVLFPGISIETIYFLSALGTLLLCIYYDRKQTKKTHSKQQNSR